MLGRGVTSFGWKWIEAKNVFFYFILPTKRSGNTLRIQYLWGLYFLKLRRLKWRNQFFDFLGFMYNLKPRKSLGIILIPSVKDTKTQSPDILYETWTYRLIRFILHQWMGVYYQTDCVCFCFFSKFKLEKLK